MELENKSENKKGIKASKRKVMKRQTLNQERKRKNSSRHKRMPWKNISYSEKNSLQILSKAITIIRGILIFKLLIILEKYWRKISYIWL